MNRRRSGVVLVALVLAAALAWWLLPRPSPESAQTVAPASTAGPITSTPPEPSASRSAGLARSDSGRGPDAGDRAARDKMRDAIWRAFGRTPPPEEVGAPKTPYVLPSALPDPPGVPGRIEPQYIKDRMHSDFFPMASDCYDEARARVPGLRGKVWLRFVLVGDAKIGGVVESADVMDKSTIRDQAMIECMRESMLSMTFPPPSEGGFVTIEYPIDFHPDEPDAG